MIHIGITATRHGMSQLQWTRVQLLAHDLTAGNPFTAHHGLCVGADAEFHEIMRSMPNSHIVGHPGPDWPNGSLCARITDCDEVLDQMPHAKRNRAIVNASQTMIAAPYESEPQPRGGTRMTIGMARQALRFFGPVGYVLRDVRALSTPVPCRGFQGFWYLTPKAERDRGEVSAVERAVLEQIR